MITCRGSLLLGTACGKCKRCETERESMKTIYIPKPHLVFANGSWSIKNINEVLANTTMNSHERVLLHLALKWIRG